MQPICVLIMIAQLTSTLLKSIKVHDIVLALENPGSVCKATATCSEVSHGRRLAPASALADRLLRGSKRNARGENGPWASPRAPGHGKPGTPARGNFWNRGYSLSKVQAVGPFLSPLVNKSETRLSGQPRRPWPGAFRCCSAARGRGGRRRPQQWRGGPGTASALSEEASEAGSSRGTAVRPRGRAGTRVLRRDKGSGNLSRACPGKSGLRSPWLRSRALGGRPPAQPERGRWEGGAEGTGRAARPAPPSGRGRRPQPATDPRQLL